MVHGNYVGVVAVLNQYSNVIGRNLTGNSDFRITVNNHPFPTTAEDEVLQDSVAGTFIGIGAITHEFKFDAKIWIVYDRHHNVCL